MNDGWIPFDSVSEVRIGDLIKNQYWKNSYVVSNIDESTNSVYIRVSPTKGISSLLYKYTIDNRTHIKWVLKRQFESYSPIQIGDRDDDI